MNDTNLCRTGVLQGDSSAGFNFDCVLQSRRKRNVLFAMRGRVD